MKFSILLLVLFVSLPENLFSQKKEPVYNLGPQLLPVQDLYYPLYNPLSGTMITNCPNSNFINGDFANWAGCYGVYNNTCQNNGFLTTGAHPIHKIIRAPGWHDSKTCGGLLNVFPGEDYVARVGDTMYTNTGGAPWKAGDLKYAVTVTPSSYLFIYRYAVVLQTGGHSPPAGQPDFKVQITDAAGVLLDPTCGYYYFSAPGSGAAPPGWTLCLGIPNGNVYWHDWATVGMDLTPYLGQTVYLDFQVRGCSFNTHFGYAYISAYCSALEIQTALCEGQTSATLTAPPGFEYLWSTGATTQSIIVPNPTTGATYSVTLTAANGCQVTITNTLTYTTINTDYSYGSACLNQPTVFTDLSTVNQNAVVDWKWDFGDSSPLLLHEQNPSHTYTTLGPKTVKLVSYSTEGCKDSITKTVLVGDVPVISLTGPIEACVNTTKIYNTDPGMSNYYWKPPMLGTITSAATSNTIEVLWTTAGADKVQVNYSNAAGCRAPQDVFINITVYDLPSPSITGNLLPCPNTSQTYTTQTGMTDYTWNVSSGGTITSGGTSTSSTLTVVWSTPGPAVISVNYTDAHNCTAAAPALLNIAVNTPQVPTIIGNAIVCNHSTGNIYTTEVGKTAYNWNVNGGIITLGGTSTDNTATVTWNAAGTQTISVNYVDDNGCTSAAATTYSVEVNNLPVPNITGSAVACIGLTSTYVTEALQNNYIWHVSPGGIIIGPANTSSINVQWNAQGSQTVDVNYMAGTGCTASSPTLKNITVNPNPTPVITGPASPCGNSQVVYSVAGAPQFNHEYQWTISGGTPTSGNNSTITVNWANTNPVSVDVVESVNYGGGLFCTGSSTTAVTLKPIPGQAGTISGPTSICQGLTKTFTITPVPNADDYTWWYLPTTGVTPAAANTGTSADFSFDLTSLNGNLFVKANSTGCPSGADSPPLAITLNPPPYMAFNLCTDLKTTSTSRPFTLKGGVPLNGTYFIDGNLAAGNLFNPATMSIGTHQITYSYTDINSCTKISTPLSIIVYSGSILSSCPVTFTDIRDDKIYHASLLAGRCWMTENLVYGNVWPDNIPQTDNCSAEKYCLPSDATCSGYGGLYQWDELMKYQLPAAGQTVQGLCPPEWHVPTLTEWQALIDGVTNPGNGIAGGTLKDLSLATGFKALLGGIYYMNNTWNFRATEIPQVTMFWTATPQGVFHATARGLNNYDYSLSLYPSSRANAFPVRCVKD